MMDAMKEALARKRGMSLDITILMDGEPVGKQMVDLSGGDGAPVEGEMPEGAETEMEEKEDDGAQKKDNSELAPPGSVPTEKEDLDPKRQAQEMQGMLGGSPRGGLRDKVSAFWDKKFKK